MALAAPGPVPAACCSPAAAAAARPLALTRRLAGHILVQRPLHRSTAVVAAHNDVLHLEHCNATGTHMRMSVGGEGLQEPIPPVIHGRGAGLGNAPCPPATAYSRQLIRFISLKEAMLPTLRCMASASSQHWVLCWW